MRTRREAGRQFRPEGTVASWGAPEERMTCRPTLPLGSGLLAEIEGRQQRPRAAASTPGPGMERQLQRISQAMTSEAAGPGVALSWLLSTGGPLGR